MKEIKCSVAQCDIFDFMAYHVGMTVLHPGGLWATEKLAEGCQIRAGSKVLDIGCGKGTGALYLARRYKCTVIGIDIERRFIEQANNLARHQGVAGQVQFQIGDALNLPFPDNEFDITLSQAFLILVPDQKQVVREALRVTKPGGFVAWLELSYHRQPTESLFRQAEASACALCIRNALTFNQWRELFLECGITDVMVIQGTMGARQRRMFRDEGLLTAIKIMGKWLFNAQIRKRMNAVFRFFRDHRDELGYGIYVGRKP